MSPVDEALSALVERLAPDAPHDETVNICRDIIASYPSSSTPEGADAIDKIKKHLNHSRDYEAALRFEELAGRLLDQPVLHNKHAMLQFLFNLAAEKPKSKSWDLPDHDAIIRSFSGNGSATGAKEETLPTLDHKALIRELPFTLQAISSTDFHFNSVGLTLPSLPLPVLHILQQIGESGLLYRQLDTFAQSTWGGLVTQAFRGEVSAELESYLIRIAGIESQIQSEEYVSLIRCSTWVSQSIQNLRFLVFIVERIKEKNGGEIASFIWNFTTHGDPHISRMASELVERVTKPIFNLLSKWVFEGELCDIYGDFFVRMRDENGDWNEKYVLEPSSIPVFMSEEVVKKVLSVGKSLEFLRRNCGDEAWVDEHSKTDCRLITFSDNLDPIVDQLFAKTSSHLLDLLISKFQLQTHLYALRQYLLLGAGDFIQLLLELLSDSLDRPASNIYRHRLTSSLDSAIRSSNAQFMDPEVLRRLDARMLEMNDPSALGWDVFTLEYKVTSPLDVIVGAYGARQYLKIFNFLWRLKRVEFILARAWRKSHTGARGILAKVEDKLGREWRASRASIDEMIHFVCQLQYYILFEVIESSWEKLQVEVEKKEGLDAVIAAHQQYLLNITHKGLLGSARSGKEDNLLVQLHEILKIMTVYADMVDSLYGISTAELARRQQHAEEIERRTAAGKWGIEDDTETQADSDEIPALRIKMEEKASDFHSRVTALLGDLAYQSDMEMRFLGIRLNYNEYYGVARRRKAKEDR